jgi:hypothetical protein
MRTLIFKPPLGVQPPLWSVEYGGMPLYGEFNDGGTFWRGILNGQGWARYIDGRVREFLQGCAANRSCDV